MADQEIPMTVDLPIPMDADLQQLAKEMPEEDFRALVITMFRYVQELVAFTRQVAATVDALGDNPMLAAMTAGLRAPQSGIIRPGNGG